MTTPIKFECVCWFVGLHFQGCPTEITLCTVHDCGVSLSTRTVHGVSAFCERHGDAQMSMLPRPGNTVRDQLHIIRTY